MANGAPGPPCLFWRNSGISRGGGILKAELLVLQELRTLGKGGYGLVVAAVNRLDGRQYAVKKIRMPSAAPVAYSRLMREVSTLARLQHPHVVRYFQVTSQACSGSQVFHSFHPVISNDIIPAFCL